MATDMNAKLGAAGVGLAPHWVDSLGMDRSAVVLVSTPHHVPLPGPNGINAHGLLVQLAMWAGDDGEAQAYWLELPLKKGIEQAWQLRSPRGVVRSFDFVPRRWPPTEALAAILTHIGHDHRIRRALGWTVEPETLGELELTVPGSPLAGWTVTAGMELSYFTPFPSREGQHLPALAGVTDPAEALAAIDAALQAQASAAS